jgi:hypothetical protein
VGQILTMDLQENELYDKPPQMFGHIKRETNWVSHEGQNTENQKENRHDPCGAMDEPVGVQRNEKQKGPGTKEQNKKTEMKV